MWSRVAAAFERHAALLLAMATVAVYAPSLRGGFLNYDDPWLIAENPVLADPSPVALGRIWLELGEKTRLALGAEYLPVRDTVEWVEARVHGLEPHAMRVLSLLLYLAAVLVLRRALRRTLGAGWQAEAAAWLFALHPVHVESVAWLAGRKDVMALLAVALALDLWSRDRRRLAAALLPIACLCKSVAVVAPLLLVVQDALAGRRTDRRWIGAGLAACLVVLAIQLRVGATVAMTTPPAGGSRLAAAATMGPVWLRYLSLSLLPVGHSLAHDVTIRSPGDPVGWLAYLPLAAWGIAGAWYWRRGDRLLLGAFLWFVVPMLPTSQVVAPLQNLMADRYLLLPVIGVGLLVLWRQVPSRPARAAIVLWIAVLAVCTGLRANLFADSISVWQDATRKTVKNTAAPYELALALEADGRTAEAEAAYREVIRRGAYDDNDRAARNNLAALLSRDPRRAPEAEAIWEETTRRYASDPKALGNLAQFLARTGRLDEARPLFDDLLRRFPGYEPGRRNRARWFK